MQTIGRRLCTLQVTVSVESNGLGDRYCTVSTYHMMIAIYVQRIDYHVIHNICVYVCIYICGYNEPHEYMYIYMYIALAPYVTYIGQHKATRKHIHVFYI